MEKISLPFFYLLGAKLNPLSLMKPADVRRVDFWLAAYSTGEYLENLLSSFAVLTVCRTAGEKLIAGIDDWTQSVSSEGAFSDLLDPAEKARARVLIGKAKDFETVLAAELEELATYHVTPKAGYSTDVLIERAESVISDSFRIKLSLRTIKEIRESGRCLVFDNATASGFHMMRAIELVMHDYYLVICKPRPKPTKLLENWGAYLALLSKETDDGVKKVVAILQQIKDQDRNFIMHPEVVLSQDEAFKLFEVAKAAIIAMADALPEPKPKKSKGGGSNDKAKAT